MSSTAPVTVPEHKEHGLYRIGDVSRIADVKPFVLRYWEGEFPMLQPVKSESGHRLYRQEDVDLVLKIRRLLYDEGFTIAGARRHLRDAMGEVTEAESGEPRRFSDAERSIELLSRGTLLDLRDALRSLLTLLEGK
jgi:DNA-binding transcriptional MerR regulator